MYFVSFSHRQKSRNSFSTVTAAWLFAAACIVLPGMAGALTQYAIGEIPDQMAYHGYTREFQLHVNDAPGAADFAMTANPQPAGQLALDAQTGVFSYTPAADDRAPFEVAFSAAGASQSVIFTPSISPPPEANVFPGTQPEPDATGYTSWQEEAVQANVELNDFVWTPQTQPARKVFISGMEVVFDRDISASPASVYGNPNEVTANSNIQEITITGDTVVIRDLLRFPQANVVIQARELRFEDKPGAPQACIVTTPIERSGKGADGVWNRNPYRPTEAEMNATPPPASWYNPETDIVPAESGKPGYDAGSVTLQIAQFHSDGGENVARFNTAGGKGQNPGAGKPGYDALDVTSNTDIPWTVIKEAVPQTNPAVIVKYLNGCYVDYEGANNLIPETTRLTGGAISNYAEMRVVRWYVAFSGWQREHQWVRRGFPWEKNGPVFTPPPPGCKPLWWLDGLDAIPPGVPGRGGDTGSVTSTLDILPYCHFEGGAPGNMLVDAQDALLIYKGGEHGMRNYTPLGDDDESHHGFVNRDFGHSYYQKDPWDIIYNPTPTFHGDALYVGDALSFCPCGCGSTYRQLMAPYEPGGDSHLSAHGKSCMAQAGEPGSGENAFVLAADSRQASDWITPVGMRKMLQYIEDLYLSGRVETVRQMLEYYIEAIDPLAPPGGDSELRQLLAEMLVLHHRASNNLDYFGNPAGWAPMLSFEANMAAFENEIDSAIQTLYLTYWLSNKSDDLDKRVAALEYAMSTLSDEMDDYIERYLAAQAAIPGIEASAEDIARRIDARRADLVDLETRLLQQAQQNIDRDAWKRNIKVASCILGMVPGAQPLFGSIGKGLEILTTIDSQTPWEMTADYVELSATTMAGGLGGITKGLGDTMKLVKAAKDDKDDDDDDDEKAQPTKEPITLALTAAQMVVGAVQGEADRLAKSVDPLVNAIKATQIGQSQVHAEMERLKASHPAFHGIAQDIQNLMRDKLVFAEKLAATLQELATASNGVTQTALGIIAIHQAKSSALAIIDERAMSYLDEMQRRARNRLLKYQYYMAKAYEYRMLKPYTGRLNLNRVFDAFLNLAELSDEAGIENGGQHLTHRLSAAEFQLLKNIYIEELRRVMADIFDELNANAPERSVPVAFALTEDELRQLNFQGSVTINLKQKNIFGRTEENIRICDLRTQSMTVRSDDGADYGGTALLRVKYEHAGRSLLDSRGQTYTFNHYVTAPINPISWKTVYDGVTGAMTETRISAASNSLLEFLLHSQGRPTDNLLLYSRPGAWADILITKESVTASGAGMIIDALRLEVEYDYFEKRNDLFELAVNVSDGLMPTILLDTPFKDSKVDVNGRGDGRGSFVRVFNPSDTVRLEAPAVYGTWVFDRWEDATGRVLKSLGSSVSTTLVMNAHKQLYARYVNTAETTAPEPPVIVTNYGQDFTTPFDTFTLAGTVGEDVVYIEINGAALAGHLPGSGYWETNLAFPYIGAHAYTIVAFDSALNASEPASIIITYNPYANPDDPPTDPTPADLSLSAAEVSLSAFAPSVTLDVINLGDLPLHWTAHTDNAGVTLNPAGPTNAAALTISAPFFNEPFTATVTVANMSDPSDTETIAVAVERGPIPADLQVSTNLLALTEAAPSAEFNIVNIGEVPMNWTIDANPPNLLVSQWSGTGPATLTVTGYDFTSLGAVAVTVRNTADPADYEVVLVQLQPTPAPGALGVSANLILLTEAMPWASFNILNLGAQNFNWTIAADSEGLLFAPQSGAAPATVTVAATQFNQDAVVTLTVENSDNPGEIQFVTVRVRRTPTPAVLAISSPTLVLTREAPSASFDVINRGDMPLLWEISCDSAAVSIDPSLGQDTTTVTVTANDLYLETVAVIVENSANRADARTIIVQLKPWDAPPGCFAPAKSDPDAASASAADVLLALSVFAGLAYKRKRTKNKTHPNPGKT